MRKCIWLLATLLLAGPASAAPFHHPFGEWREYNHDWLSACPDAIDEDATDYYGYSCFASAGSQTLNGAGLPDYKLTLIRNRLDGTLDLSIVVAPDQGTYDESRPMVLSFAGEAPVSLVLGKDIETRFNTTNQYFVIGPERVDALIERMKERNAVTLSVPLSGTDKPAQTRLSLRGVLASLDFMATYARKVKQY